MFNLLHTIFFGKTEDNQEEIKEKEKVVLQNKDKKEKPSVEFCKTGILVENEKYNQNLHFYSKTIKGRACPFYTEEEIKIMIKEVETPETTHEFSRTNQLNAELLSEIEEGRFIHDMNN